MFRCLAFIAAAWLAFSLWAGPDDDFVEIYQLIQQTDAQREAGQLKAARSGYQRAQELLRQLEKDYPQWNERVVAYRLRYVAEKVAALPAEPVEPVPAPSPAPAVVSEPPAAPGNEVLTQFNALNTQIAELRAAKQRLEAKLREALTAQPAPVDPKELQAAVERITQLQSTNKTLLTQLELQQTERRNLVDKVLVEEARTALAAANQQLSSQREKTVELERLRNLAEGELKRMTTENSTLKSQVTELQADTERGQQIANLTARVAKLQTGLSEAERQNEVLVADRDKLEKQLADLGARRAEEGIVRVKQLETDLAVAKAEADRQTTRAEQIEGRLAQEKGARVALEQENRSLVDRVQALTEQTAGMKALQTQLSAEQEERTEVEAQLRAAEDQLAAARRRTVPTNTDGTEGIIATSAALPDPALIAQLQMLESETGRLRDVLRDSRARQTELAALLADAEKSRIRLEREKRDLVKSLTDLQKTPAQQQLARSNRTVDSLEARVRDLEKERDKLTQRLAAATQKSQAELKSVRRARFGSPPEEAVRFRMQRNGP